MMMTMMTPFGEEKHDNQGHDRILCNFLCPEFLSLSRDFWLTSIDTTQKSWRKCEKESLRNYHPGQNYHKKIPWNFFNIFLVAEK